MKGKFHCFMFQEGTGSFKAKQLNLYNQESGGVAEIDPADSPL